jgi:hypothetical protein
MSPVISRPFDTGTNRPGDRLCAQPNEQPVEQVLPVVALVELHGG